MPGSVPAPLNKHREPEIPYVLKSGEAVFRAREAQGARLGESTPTSQISHPVSRIPCHAQN